jgi:predicted phosphate transport protein (TIGR00153 family)
MFASKKTKKLETQIDEFLDKILSGSLQFKQGVKYYIENLHDMFEKTLTEISTTEESADNLRRTIETKLYLHTLIPEYRGDVLGLLESVDKVLNKSKETIFQYSVEKPNILPEFASLFLELTNTSVTSVEYMVYAVRAYFSDYQKVRDNINKSVFYEKEADVLADKLKREIFANTNLGLAEKIHLRYFTYHIEQIADSAEDVCDRLSIAVIKRFG